ncbi:uncharacterized protein STEHIDRAFT_154461 [Stereum hirsutum FP-91666 SS1]|uniref:uncharacterized protein n=1 Tax=Stereum hirsutum (strain FP-91666) TaxID=721885 RepID=UPI000440A3BF|nr:uncharacterized protein STEHIDRAFT_154461 [Stereum hirsutum FP-91666 SS1]EIM88737.1 hypothetical protein STEHIDRAFT_154461 [Stereum hirsutum FP-91666 SS1]
MSGVGRAEFESGFLFDFDLAVTLPTISYCRLHKGFYDTAPELISAWPEIAPPRAPAPHTTKPTAFGLFRVSLRMLVTAPQHLLSSINFVIGNISPLRPVTFLSAQIVSSPRCTLEGLAEGDFLFWQLVVYEDWNGAIMYRAPVPAEELVRIEPERSAPVLYRLIEGYLLMPPGNGDPQARTTATLVEVPGHGNFTNIATFETGYTGNTIYTEPCVESHVKISPVIEAFKPGPE